MAKLKLKPPNAWENRFLTPSFIELKGGQNKTMGMLLEAARDRLLAFEGVRSEIAWQGIPWRWTLVFRVEGEEAVAFAYLVPEPGKLQIAVPLRREFLESLQVKRLPRTIRDRIVFASEVAGVFWARFEFASRGQLDEIVDLLQRKQAFTAAPAAT